MSAAIRTGLLLLAASLALGGVYIGILIISVERQGYAWSEMDWNQDGTTTLTEYFMSSDVGKRATARDGDTCTEYFHYKDGSSIRLACEQENQH